VIAPPARTTTTTGSRTRLLARFVYGPAAMTVPGSLFQHAISAVVSAATGVPTTDLKVEAPPRPDLGDYAVGCFPAAKRLGKAPALVAQEIAAAFQPSPSCWRRPARPARSSTSRSTRRRLPPRHPRAPWPARWCPTGHGAGQTICIDYSSPNISKHLAYHHIRSTCIGHSLAQIFRALGYRVVGINHLGDWGTTHGMLIAAARSGASPIRSTITVALNELYVRYREAIKAEPALEAEARAWFKKLEDGDAEARGLWQRFRDVSWAEFAAVYDLLGIRFDEVRGESAYEPDLAGVLAEFAGKGLVSESDGAQVVVLEGEKTPLLLVTKDGTTLYATRDHGGGAVPVEPV
jgi:arginyl-tRNA synthetase